MKHIRLICSIAAALGISIAPSPACGQTDDVKIPTERNLGTKHKNYSEADKGFFFSADADGGYSIVGKGRGLGMVGINLTGGYRFSEYLRVGAGFGPRFHFDNHSDKTPDGLFRTAAHNAAMALYANIRGNFIPSDYRTVVPYWSVNLGGVFPDGMMAAPTIGVRIGEKRSAFLLGLTYSIRQIRETEHSISEEAGSHVSHKATSFLGISAGYEF